MNKNVMQFRRDIGSWVLICMFGLFVSSCVNQEQRLKEEENIKIRARAHTDLGAVYFQQKQYEIAMEEFTQAIKIDPNFGLAYNGLGLVNAALGQDNVAEENFKKSIQVEPKNSESHNNYGGFLCARGRYDDSIIEFMAALKNPLYSTPAIAFTNAGICSMRKKDMVVAENFLQKALQLDPLSNMAAYQLALIQFKNNEAILAKNTLQNVMLGKPGPELLWLAIQVERALGGKDAEASYAIQLRRQYPESEQAKLLQSGK